MDINCIDMKIYDTFKISREMADDGAFIGAYAKRQMRRTKYKFLMKGKKAIPEEIRLYEDGEDFVRNIMTAAIIYKVIKIPRFANPLRK